MIIDIIIAVIVIVWAIYGYRKGFVRQLFTLAGILAVTFFSLPIAEIAEHILADEYNIFLPSRHMELILISTTAAAIYIIVFLIGRFFHETLVKGIKPAEKTDHILGMVLSIIESSLAVYFILCLAANYQDKVQKYAPKVNNVMCESICYTGVKDYNLLSQYHLFKRNSNNQPDSNQPQDPASPDTTQDNTP